MLECEQCVLPARHSQGIFLHTVNGLYGEAIIPAPEEVTAKYCISSTNLGVLSMPDMWGMDAGPRILFRVGLEIHCESSLSSKVMTHLVSQSCKLTGEVALDMHGLAKFTSPPAPLPPCFLPYHPGGRSSRTHTTMKSLVQPILFPILVTF